MSNAIACSKPARRATSPAPTTPPAGPDTRIVAGCAAASSTEATPPEDSITSGSGRPAHAPRPRARAGSGPRRERDTRRPPSSTRARTRGTPVRPRATPRHARRDGGAAAPRRPLARATRPGTKEQADGDRLRVADVGQRRQVERLELSVRPNATAYAIRALERNERRRMLVAEAVEMRARLPAQVQEMLEALVRDERRAGTAPLEQRVRRNGCPVREADDALRADGARCGQHGFLLAQSRRHLRGPHAPTLEKHCIGERPADIDAQDRHARTLHRRGHSRTPVRLRRTHPRYRDRLARGLGVAVPRARAGVTGGEMGADRRHDGRLGPDGPPGGARRRAARARRAERAPVRA